MLKLEQCREEGTYESNYRDKALTKSKNAYTKKVRRNYWVRRLHEKQFLKSVLKHVFEENGLSFEGIVWYVKSGQFESDILEEMKNREIDESGNVKEML